MVEYPSNMNESDQKESGRRVLRETDHPEFGKCITFIDENGPGTQIGEGAALFIVRPTAPGVVSIEAQTDEAKEAAKRLYGNILSYRGGHR